MRVLTKVRSFFMTKEGKKETLCRKRFFLLLGVITSLMVLMVIFFKSQDSSLLIIHSWMGATKKADSHTQKKDNSLKANSLGTKDLGKNSLNHQESEVIRELLDSSASLKPSSHTRKVQKTKKRPSSKKTAPIIYRASLVVKRKDIDVDFMGEGGLPIGTNLKGRLLTSIDTRETKQLYKVLLPKGGRDKRGGFIPKDSLLFGHISYPGQGHKVFIQFSKILLPDGLEVPIMAQALNAKDLSPGLVGDFHGKAKQRVASTLGLTMLSAMTDTLTQKGSHFYAKPTPKSTLKNAFYQGVSQASEMEAKRQADRLANQPEYVTLPAGTEMIVNLLETYRGGYE